MGCIMSSYKKSQGDDFYARILQVTQDARKNVVSHRKDIRDKINQILKSHIEHLLESLVRHTIKEIDVTAHANGNNAPVYEFDSNNTIIKIVATNQKNLEQLISRLTLAHLTTTHTQKMIHIRFNGFVFTEKDLIKMPSMTGIIKYLQTRQEISKFKFTKEMTLASNATNIPVICVSWPL